MQGHATHDKSPLAQPENRYFQYLMQLRVVA
jgi:hypothetical protein